MISLLLIALTAIVTMLFAYDVAKFIFGVIKDVIYPIVIFALILIGLQMFVDYTKGLDDVTRYSQSAEDQSGSGTYQPEWTYDPVSLEDAPRSQGSKD